MRIPIRTTRPRSRAVVIALCALTFAPVPVVSANAASPTSIASASVHADTARIPAGYMEQKVLVNGIHINYVRGGHGPTLVLLHGFPETWYTWRKILPALAAHYTVIAP